MTDHVTDKPQQAAINAVTSGETGASTLAAATIPTATEATPARTATGATSYVTMIVAPGDGELLPPRFSGDRKVDADEWVQDLLDCIEIRSVPKPTATVLLRVTIKC